MHERTTFGLDVHARSVVGCAIDGETGEVHRAKLPPDFREIDRWLAGLEGPLAVV
jgi:transposase